MPQLMLFVAGESFDVDAFLADSRWKERARVFRKGTKTGLSRIPLSTRSGFGLPVGDELEELPQQMDAASDFLTRDADELSRLADLPPAIEMELRFGVYWHRDSICIPLTLPRDLVGAAGKVGLSISVFVYGAADAES